MNDSAGIVAGSVWAVAAALLTASTLADATDSGRGVLVGAGIVGVSAAAAAVVALSRSYRRWATFGFFLSAIFTPSGFAYALNLLPLTLAVWLVVDIGRQSRAGV